MVEPGAIEQTSKAIVLQWFCEFYFSIYPQIYPRCCVTASRLRGGHPNIHQWPLRLAIESFYCCSHISRV